jgi:hypothetical protein
MENWIGDLGIWHAGVWLFDLHGWGMALVSFSSFLYTMCMAFKLGLFGTKIY